MMTVNKGVEQREQELGRAPASGNSGGQDNASSEENRLLSAVFGPSQEELEKERAEQDQKRITSYSLLGTLLFLTIIGGVLRHHMEFCLNALESKVDADISAS